MSHTNESKGLGSSKACRNAPQETRGGERESKQQGTSTMWQEIGMLTVPKRDPSFPLFLPSKLNLVAQPPNLLLDLISGEQQTQKLASCCTEKQHSTSRLLQKAPEISHESTTVKTLPTKQVRNQDPAWMKYSKTLSTMDRLQQIKIGLLLPFQKLKFYEVITDDKSGIQLTWESQNICNSQFGPLILAKQLTSLPEVLSAKPEEALKLIQVYIQWVFIAQLSGGFIVTLKGTVQLLSAVLHRSSGLAETTFFFVAQNLKESKHMTLNKYCRSLHQQHKDLCFFKDTRFKYVPSRYVQLWSYRT